MSAKRNELLIAVAISNYIYKCTELSHFMQSVINGWLELTLVCKIIIILRGLLLQPFNYNIAQNYALGLLNFNF